MAKLSKHKAIYDHIIKLINPYEKSYGYIYYLRLIKLEILKIHIKTNLANSFISFLISIINARIFFIKNKIIAFIYIKMIVGELFFI